MNLRDLQGLWTVQYQLSINHDNLAINTLLPEANAYDPFNLLVKDLFAEMHYILSIFWIKKLGFQLSSSSILGAK